MEENTFGRYRLIDLLGRGGMGQVYRAHDTATDRVVALKVLPPHLAEDPTFQHRFRREAHTAAGLTDPHVVPIHSYGEIGGRLYVDMRLIEGRDLGDVLSEGPMDPARAVRIIEQVAEALDAAHAVGLVHRDVKPSNILLARRDFVYLIDFGIAIAAGGTRYTSTGAALGTLAYMAPERFDDEEPGPLSDVYALTCVLHECLTGRQPFPGSSLEKQMAGHLTKPPPRPSAIEASVSPKFDDVIAKGMAKNPAERTQSAIELADAARAALDSRPTEPIPPRPPGATAVVPTQQAPVWRPPPPPAPLVRTPVRQPDRPPAGDRDTGPVHRATGSKLLRIAGLLLAATVFIATLAPNLNVYRGDSYSALSVLPDYYNDQIVVLAVALSYLVAAAAFVLIALHLRSRRSHVITVAAAWAASAAFVVLAAVSVLNYFYFGSETVAPVIAVVAFAFLVVFGVTAAITTRQAWMSWAAAGAVFGIVACIYDVTTPPGGGTYHDDIASALLAALLVFAFYVYLAGRKRLPNALSVPGMLVMAFALLTALGWLASIGRSNVFRRYPWDFFRYFDPYTYFFAANVFLVEVFILALALALLATKLRPVRRNIVAVVIAWLLSVGLVMNGLASTRQATLTLFALLAIFGAAGAIPKRRAWALYACAAGVLGALMWWAVREIPEPTPLIIFAAWCALFFMFGLSLYRAREDAVDPAGPVDSWAPTVQRRP